MPSPTLWHEPLVSSRLLQYEVWTRIHAYDLGPTHSEEARGGVGHERCPFCVHVGRE